MKTSSSHTKLIGAGLAMTVLVMAGSVGSAPMQGQVNISVLCLFPGLRNVPACRQAATAAQRESTASSSAGTRMRMPKREYCGDGFCSPQEIRTCRLDCNEDVDPAFGVPAPTPVSPDPSFEREPNAAVWEYPTAPLPMGETSPSVSAEDDDENDDTSPYWVDPSITSPAVEPSPPWAAPTPGPLFDDSDENDDTSPYWVEPSQPVPTVENSPSWNDPGPQPPVRNDIVPYWIDPPSPPLMDENEEIVPLSIDSPPQPRIDEILPPWMDLPPPPSIEPPHNPTNPDACVMSCGNGIQDPNEGCTIYELSSGDVFCPEDCTYGSFSSAADTTGADACGDGACAAGETHATCPMDCADIKTINDNKECKDGFQWNITIGSPSRVGGGSDYMVPQGEILHNSDGTIIAFEADRWSGNAGRTIVVHNRMSGNTQRIVAPVGAQDIIGLRKDGGTLFIDGHGSNSPWYEYSFASGQWTEHPSTDPWMDPDFGNPMFGGSPDMHIPDGKGGWNIVSVELDGQEYAALMDGEKITNFDLFPGGMSVAQPDDQRIGRLVFAGDSYGNSTDGNGVMIYGSNVYGTYAAGANNREAVYVRSVTATKVACQ